MTASFLVISEHRSGRAQTRASAARVLARPGSRAGVPTGGAPVATTCKATNHGDPIGWWSAAHVLLRPLLHAVEGCVDVLQRIGHAEAQVAFAEGAERRAGQRGDARVFQERVGNFL